MSRFPGLATRAVSQSLITRAISVSDHNLVVTLAAIAGVKQTDPPQRNRHPAPRILDSATAAPNREPAYRSLLDNLFGAHQHRLRHSEAERLGSLEVDDQLEFGRLLDRQIGRLGTLEDLSGVNAD
jgi:hypothetical protein